MSGSICARGKLFASCSAGNDHVEHYAPAYRTGYEGFTKYPGKKYEEIEDDLALDYEKNAVGSLLPRGCARPAAKVAWEKLSGVRGPRDPARGIRSGSSLRQLFGARRTGAIGDH
jgi:hypothetical protein